MTRRELVKMAGKVGVVALVQAGLGRFLDAYGILDDLAAEAAALPQNYQVRAGTMLLNSTLASLAQNSLSGGDVTIAVTNETGAAFMRPAGVTNVLKLDVTSPGTTASTWNLRWDLPVDLKTVHMITCPLYYAPANGSTTGWSAVFQTGQAANMLDRWTYPLGSADPQLIRPGWMTGVCARNKPASTTGSPSLGSNFGGFRWQISVPAGATGAIYIGPTYINAYNRPKVMFVLDDAATSQYTEGFSYLSARGLKGSLAVTSNFGTMIQSQRDEMYAGGWSFHNHSDTHVDLTTLDAAGITAELAACKSYLQANGYSRGAQSMVYPGGGVNDLVQSVAQGLGYTTGWTIGDRLVPQWDGMDQPMRLRRWNMGSANSLATLKAKIDDAIAYGMAAPFYGHNILVGATGFDTEKATFQGLVDYAYKLQLSNILDVVTLQEWIDGLTSPRRSRS